MYKVFSTRFQIRLPPYISTIAETEFHALGGKMRSWCVSGCSFKANHLIKVSENLINHWIKVPRMVVIAGTGFLKKLPFSQATLL